MDLNKISVGGWFPEDREDYDILDYYSHGERIDLPLSIVFERRRNAHKWSAPKEESAPALPPCPMCR